ncbi:MAG: alpha/beta hydrolase-fold protein, partial [Pyrinomonadaceae bacterium]
MKKVLILLIAWLILFGVTFAQRSTTADASGVQRAAGLIHDVHTFVSKTLGEERTVLVTLPRTYEKSDAKYPVVLMLDAHEPQNAMMAGILEQQAWGGKIPETILVGIQNTNRVRDLTPTSTERQSSGGGPKFLQFIETEVLPLVDKNYRTQPYRIFAGHSLGGLFVMYTFTEKPELFSGYIAASPVLHWDNKYVIKRAEALFKIDREWKKRMFVSIGDEPEYVESFNAFQALIKREKPKDLDVEFRQFKDENHGSVVLPAYYAGLRKIFEGWTLKQIGTLDEAESHFRLLSAHLGFSVLPSEGLLSSIGYELWTNDQKDAAIRVFRRNTEIHPTLPRPFDNLATAYEKTGRLKQAREYYEKAYRVAE